MTATKTQTVSRNVTTVTKRPAVNAHWTDAEGDLISEDQGEPSDLHFYLHPSQQHHFTSDPHMSEDRTSFQKGLMHSTQTAVLLKPAMGSGHTRPPFSTVDSNVAVQATQTHREAFFQSTHSSVLDMQHTRTHTLKHHNVRHKQAKLLSY